MSAPLGWNEAEFVLIVDRVGGDDFDPGYPRYSIAAKCDVKTFGRRVHPLMHFNHGRSHILAPSGESVLELKAVLRAMLKACDTKPMRIVESACVLEPVKNVDQSRTSNPK